MLSARLLLAALSAVIATGCASPTHPSVVSIWSVKYMRVHGVTQPGTRVALVYSYPAPACTPMQTSGCQSGSTIAGVHELTQVDRSLFVDPLATLFADVPVDTTIVMKVVDEAVDLTLYIAEQIYVDGIPIHIQRFTASGDRIEETGTFKMRYDGTVY